MPTDPYQICLAMTKPHRFWDTSTDDTKIAYLAILDEKEYEVLSRDSSSGLNLGFKGFSLDFSESYSAFVERRREFFESEGIDIDIYKTSQNYVEGLPQEIAQEVNRCVEIVRSSENGGLSLFEPQMGEGQALIRYRWIPRQPYNTKYVLALEPSAGLTVGVPGNPAEMDLGMEPVDDSFWVSWAPVENKKKLVLTAKVFAIDGTGQRQNGAIHNQTLEFESQSTEVQSLFGEWNGRLTTIRDKSIRWLSIKFEETGSSDVRVTGTITEENERTIIGRHEEFFQLEDIPYGDNVRIRPIESTSGVFSLFFPREKTDVKSYWERYRLDCRMRGGCLEVDMIERLTGKGLVRGERLLYAEGILVKQP